MRAVLQTALGGPEVLRVAEVDRPAPGPGEVLVRVHAAGVNPVDAIVRAGLYPLLGEPPFVLGWDVSGVVEQAGGGYQVGDEVYGMPRFPGAANAYAEYVTAPADDLARKPASLDHVHAAALPLAVLTAWQGLVDGAEIAEGQRVLVHGAAGGVGHLAVQIAKAHGAHVIALAGAAKHEFVRGLGADEVIDYQATDFTTVLADLDVVFDSVRQSDRSLTVLRPGGVLVTIKEQRDEALAARVTAAGRRVVGTSVVPDGPALAAVAALVDQGRIRVHVGETFTFAEVAKAHELIESGHTTGKIVLTV
ncbi:NADP-dependent oxidoreductase [Umezawaea sp. Da 62-37]|uniref:NADP-dependent oxidoreductase n=1 Tax=Umezawaea sp. Da 62-37 TaxID=3075927 RepID=UPI0028F7391F|nr:NADP-dependent oxidoreductase [Umezawaea sp. Da 62-37]WNV84387.1 NADP-dependent oxidoreductase [Umezawaea sp. Da 62-37]